MICNLPRPEVAEIDLSAERIWPPARLEQLSGWRCRLDRGISRRANSVLATAWSGGDLEQDCQQVDALYQKAISLGAADEGRPGPRGDAGFYAGYFRDLDGNKLNAFCMG